MNTNILKALANTPLNDRGQKWHEIVNTYLEWACELINAADDVIKENYEKK